MCPSSAAACASSRRGHTGGAHERARVAAVIHDPDRVVIVRGLPRVIWQDIDALVEAKTGEPPLDISFKPPDTYGRPGLCIIRCRSVAHASAVLVALDGVLYRGRWLRADRARRVRA